MVLAAQRSYPASLAGRWEFPGGKVEDGEEPEDALRREIREELGIGIAIGRRLRSARGDWRLHNGMDMRLWLARPTGEPQCGPSHALRGFLPAYGDQGLRRDQHGDFGG